ncbi:uncharacterized protein LOC123011479 [Tribolium madens]|uniref:uncharacterized protein LOC123011479 n=1 Tax=Tribolium madens TaxID=41895 RepID=UPI001CF75DFB|nr:uncharacterized protein LOC123011479 [Tribolium madens]
MSGKQDGYVYFRNRMSSSVLQADERYVSIKRPSKIGSQLWAPDYLHHGKVKIVTKSNEFKVLDMEGTTYGSKIITAQDVGPEKETQYWHIGYHGDIVNAKTGLCISIPQTNNSYPYGLEVVGHYFHGGDWQRFTIEHVDY